MADLLLARFLDTAAQFMTLVLVGAMLPGFVLGVVLALGAPAAWRWASGRLRAWWLTTEKPETLAIRAAVACARVPLEHRRAVVKGLKTLWGEGPFREIQQAPPKVEPAAKPAKPEDLPGVYTVHPAHGREH